MMRHLSIFVAAGLALGACATQPEPCTAEWVEWKTDKIMRNFGLANYSSINKLKDFSEDLRGEPGPLTMMRLPGMIEEFQELALDFQQDAWPALEEAASQCGTPEKLVPAFITFLEDEGVDGKVLEWVELLSELV